MADWLRGDFRGVRRPGPDGILGNADDLNRVPRPVRNATTGALTRVEFPTPNVIPDNLINPTARALLSYLPPANAADASNPLHYQTTASGADFRHLPSFKIDHRVSNANNFFVRYAREISTANNPFQGGGTGQFYPAFRIINSSKRDSVAFSDTHVFSQRLLNEFRFGYFIARIDNTGTDDRDYVSLLGLTLPGSRDTFGFNNKGFPTFQIDGFIPFGDQNTRPAISRNNNYQFTNIMNYATGNANWRFGGEWTHTTNQEFASNQSRGLFRIRGRRTNPTGAVSSGLYSFADFLLGQLDTATITQLRAPVNYLGIRPGPSFIRTGASTTA